MLYHLQVDDSPVVSSNNGVAIAFVCIASLLDLFVFVVVLSDTLIANVCISHSCFEQGGSLSFGCFHKVF